METWRRLKADNGRENLEPMNAPQLKYHAQRLLSIMGTHLICFVTFLMSLNSVQREVGPTVFRSSFQMAPWP